MIKKCGRCLLDKNHDEFAKNKSKRDGLDGWCLSCKREYQLIYNVSHREHQAEYAKERRISHPEEIKKSKKKTYKKNRNVILKRNAAYQQEKLNTDPGYKIKHLLRDRIRKAIKNGYKSGSAVKDLGCTIEEFKAYIESKFYNNMSWDTYGSGWEKWQLDHIVPLYKFDLSVREELLKACHYTNMQPLWYEDHLVKTIKDLQKVL